jgi:hypothetical protein
MKNNKLVLIISLLFSIISFSQGRLKNKKDQINALKVGFITKELELTPDEAVKFWPLYNTFDENQFALKQKKMKSLTGRWRADLESISESEASLLLAQIESTEDELQQNRKKFISSLKNVLPDVKIIKLKRAEDNFNRTLLEQYRDRGPRK